MEKYAAFLILGLVLFLVLRLLWTPLRFGLKVLLHSAGGFLSLTLVDAFAAVSGIMIPINAVSVLTAGFFGVPGILLLALLELVP